MALSNKETSSTIQDRTTPVLFSPLRLRGVTLKNRIMASPMCQYQSVNGMPTDWHTAHLGRLAIGGAGLVFYEETAVEEHGRKTYQCAGLWNQEQVAPLRRLCTMLDDMGAVPAIQLGHAGGLAASHGATRDWAPLTEADAQNGLPPWKPVSASAIRLEDGRQICQALTPSELSKLVQSFVTASLRSLEAGFRIIEIHAAHGYLIHQFLSPVTNLRTDGYGGERLGRMRFALEIAEAVRTALPDDIPLFYRLSCVDGYGGIWNMDDTVALATALGERGVDVIDCSSGGISGSSDMPRVPRIPGYHVPYASRVRDATGIMTVAVGMITDPLHAEEILESGSADIIALARGLLEDSEWPVLAAQQLGLEDPFAILPLDYAFRLRKREQVARMPGNQPFND